MQTLQNKSPHSFCSARTFSTEVYQSLSPWLDVRVTEMAGYDYVFAPMSLCDQITDFITLQEFLINIQAVIGSDLQRTILIGTERAEDGSLEMDRYDAVWSDSVIIDCHRTSLEGSPQFDFIRMLQQHSSPLIDE